MKPIAELADNYATRLEKQALEAAEGARAFRQLVEVWPQERLLDRFYHSRMSGRRLGELHCEAVVDTRYEALEYLIPFKLEPLAYMKDTFTTIRAIAWNEDTMEKANQVITDILPVFWSFGDYGKASLKCFLSFGDLRVSLQIKITKDQAVRSIMRNEQGHIVHWILRKAPEGEVVKYASGGPEHTGDVLVYFPEEPGNGPNLKEYLERRNDIEWRAR